MKVLQSDCDECSTNRIPQFTQGEMTVAEAIKNFERLTKLCPYLVPIEEQRTKWMLEKLRSDIVLAIKSGGNTPTTTMECTERAYRAEHWLNQLKEMSAIKFESKKKSSESFGKSKSQRGKQFLRQDSNRRKRNCCGTRNTKSHSTKRVDETAPNYEKCGGNHSDECRAGTNLCFNCGKKGHFVKKGPTKFSTDVE